MKYTLILLTALLIGCSTGPMKITKSGPFIIMEKHPDQLKNLKDAPGFHGMWVIDGVPSGFVK